tara:strand:- start:695 stop:1096 length:402 start_codon:yes stop_codon:yes gene_type:complete
MLRIRIDCVEALTFVSKLTGELQGNILSKGRKRDYVVARHLLRYYLRKHTKMTLAAIGKVTDSRHATVIHSVKYVYEYAEVSPSFKAYKDSIDSKSLIEPQEVRDLVTLIIKSQKGTQEKCDLIMAIINKEDG